MKMIYGNTPIKSFNVRHFEMNTNDATLKSSDLQDGVTAYARGQKVTGSGKAFAFALYGGCMTCSYEINHPEWISVYYASDEYIGKYYNFSDGLWYYDSGYTEIFDTDSLYN